MRADSPVDDADSFQTEEINANKGMLFVLLGEVDNNDVMICCDFVV